MNELQVFYQKYPNSQHKQEADKLLADIKRKIEEEKEQAKKAQGKKEETANKIDQEN